MGRDFLGSNNAERQQKLAEQANLLLSDYFTTEEYSVEIANTMSQPPRDLAAVAKLLAALAAIERALGIDMLAAGALAKLQAALSSLNPGQLASALGAI